MDFSYYLENYNIDKIKLKSLGFEEKNNVFLKELNFFNNDFTLKIRIGENEFSGEVIEKATGEVFLPIEMKNASGKFVSNVKSEVDKIITSLLNDGFVYANTKENVLEFLKTEFGAMFEKPWKEYPSFITCKVSGKNKWFALFMTIDMKKLNPSKEGMVDVINLKNNPQKISEIIDNKTIFPAYHMNKKHWLTVVLNKETDVNALKQLIKESYDLVL